MSTPATNIMRYGLALVALSFLASGCGGSADWRKQTLQLKAVGYKFAATKTQPAAWSGSGVWIDQNTMVTNAHVATRALQLKGKDDYGNTFDFTQIVALDPRLDIAVVRSSRPNEDVYSTLRERPEDPRSLRGEDVRAIGNTGGMGLSFYTGKVTNVIGGKGSENLVHSADISSGSSGGPLFDGDNNVLGINKAISHALRMSFATPAWLVLNILRNAKGNWGIEMKKAFAPQNMPIALAVKRQFCLKPGQKVVAPMQVVGTADLVVVVKRQPSAQPLFFGLVRGRKLMAKGNLTKDIFAAWDLPGSGVYGAILVNPPKSPETICGAIGVGRVAWEKRIR